MCDTATLGWLDATAALLPSLNVSLSPLLPDAAGAGPGGDADASVKRSGASAREAVRRCASVQSASLPLGASGRYDESGRVVSSSRHAGGENSRRRQQPAHRRTRMQFGL